MTSATVLMPTLLQISTIFRYFIRRISFIFCCIWCNLLFFSFFFFLDKGDRSSTISKMEDDDEGSLNRSQFQYSCSKLTLQTSGIDCASTSATAIAATSTTDTPPNSVVAAVLQYGKNEIVPASKDSEDVRENVALGKYLGSPDPDRDSCVDTSASLANKRRSKDYGIGISPRPKRVAAKKKLFKCTECEDSFVIDYQLKSHIKSMHKSKPCQTEAGRDVATTNAMKSASALSTYPAIDTAMSKGYGTNGQVRRSVRAKTLPKKLLETRSVSEDAPSNSKRASFKGDALLKSMKSACMTSDSISHTGAQKPLFNCPACSKGFRNIEQLHSHQCSRTKCLQCHLTFASPCELDAHNLNTHNQDAMENEVTEEVEKERQFDGIICSMCGKIFANKRRLCAHMKTHSTDWKFVCKHCGKGFHRQDIYKSHTRLHTGEQPFLCSECGKSYSFRGSLHRHLKTHSSRAEFECSECGRGFHEKINLTAHMNMHAGHRPYRCLDCGKCYPSKHSLSAHMKRHLGEKPFKCNECGRSFFSRHTLKIHIVSHSNDRPFKCKECDKGFTREIHLKYHMAIHTGVRSFKCQKCDKGFYSKRHLYMHMRGHQDRFYTCEECGESWKNKQSYVIHMEAHRDTPYACDVCGSRFVTKKQLMMHINTHPDDMLFKCQLCDKIFKFKDTLTKHMQTHNDVLPMVVTDLTKPGEKLFQCGQCQKVFKSIVAVRNHIKAAGTDNSCCSKSQANVKFENKCLCNDCGKGFRYLCQLKRHMRIHMESDQKPCPCPVCGKRFVDKFAMQVHLTRHSSERPFKCHLCGRGYGVKSRLQWHLKSHSEDKPHKCEDCGKGYLCPSGLAVHRRLNHSGREKKRRGRRKQSPQDYRPNYKKRAPASNIRPHWCQLCAKGFTTSWSLKDHLQRHSDQRAVFPCRVCGKAIKSQRGLEVHMKSHSDEKPFKCELCDKAYSVRCRLTWHVKCIHSDEKPFPCPICPKRFVYQSSLDHHMRIHTGERPFQCIACGKGYINSSLLKKHFRISDCKN